ncbi:hypothetical protein [Tepidimicrobium xylanilyticum]|nr:hypothetical protein [Tepidimicrobium xylanilyticum]GMG96238.1 hypothetical protein EN5CB1_10640 [Tepidimicrobium xylanilyticum]
MKKIRAIYIGDVRFNNCPVFELKEKSCFDLRILNIDMKKKKSN